jgi:hypothetical protein
MIATAISAGDRADIEPDRRVNARDLFVETAPRLQPFDPASHGSLRAERADIEASRFSAHATSAGSSILGSWVSATKAV